MALRLPGFVKGFKRRAEDVGEALVRTSPIGVAQEAFRLNRELSRPLAEFTQRTGRQAGRVGVDLLRLLSLSGAPPPPANPNAPPGQRYSTAQREQVSRAFAAPFTPVIAEQDLGQLERVPLVGQSLRNTVAGLATPISLASLAFASPAVVARGAAGSVIAGSLLPPLAARTPLGDRTFSIAGQEFTGEQAARVIGETVGDPIGTAALRPRTLALAAGRRSARGEAQALRTVARAVDDDMVALAEQEARVDDAVRRFGQQQATAEDVAREQQRLNQLRQQTASARAYDILRRRVREGDVETIQRYYSAAPRTVERLVQQYGSDEVKRRFSEFLGTQEASYAAARGTVEDIRPEPATLPEPGPEQRALPAPERPLLEAAAEPAALPASRVVAQRVDPGFRAGYDIGAGERADDVLRNAPPPDVVEAPAADFTQIGRGQLPVRHGAQVPAEVPQPQPRVDYEPLDLDALARGAVEETQERAAQQLARFEEGLPIQLPAPGALERSAEMRNLVEQVRQFARTLTTREMDLFKEARRLDEEIRKLPEKARKGKAGLMTGITAHYSLLSRHYARQFLSLQDEARQLERDIARYADEVGVAGAFTPEAEALRQRFDDLWNRAEQLRDEFYTAVQQRIPPAPRDPRFTHTPVAGTGMTWGEAELTALANSGLVRTALEKVETAWQKVLGRLPGFGSLPAYMDPSILLGQSYLGRQKLAYEMLKEQIHSQVAASVEIARRYRPKFDIDKKLGIEKTSGLHILDLMTQWDQYKHLFDSETQEFMDVLRRIHLDALEHANRLGVDVPDEWIERGLYGMRQLVGVEGKENARDVLRRAFSGITPDSFHEIYYEHAIEGALSGLRYNTDPLSAVIVNALAVRTYAARHAYRMRIKNRGILKSSLLAPEVRLKVIQTRAHLASVRKLERYLNEAYRGRPGRPIIRDKPSVNYTVPDAIKQAVDRVDAIVKNQEITPKERQQLILALKQELNIEGMLSSAKLAVKEAVEERQKRLKDISSFRVKATAFQHIPGELPLDVVGGTVLTAPAPATLHLQGRLFLPEDAALLNRLENERVPGFLEAMDAFTAEVKPLATGLDYGYWMVFGPLGALQHDIRATLGYVPARLLGQNALTPGAMPRAMFQSLKAFFDERRAAKYWEREFARHPELARQYMQYVHGFASQFDTMEVARAFRSGGLVDRIDRAVPGHPFHRFQHSFSQFINVSQWEMYKSMHVLADGDPEKLAALGRIIRNTTGRTTTAVLGASHTQRAVERTLIRYAPAFTRGVLALFLKMLTPNFEGRRAWEAVLGWFGAGLMIIGLASMIKEFVQADGDITRVEWNDTWEDLFNAAKPGPRFMSIRIGDNYWGLGGTMRATMNLLLRTGEAVWNGEWDRLNPVDRSSRLGINQNSIFVQYIRSGLPPAPSTAWDIATGRDYVGYRYDEDGNIVAISALQDQGLSFVVDAYMEANGGRRSKSLVGAWNFIGGTSFPVAKRVLYEEAAAEEAGVESFDEIKGTPFLTYMREHPDEYPETAAAWQAYRKDRERRGSAYETALKRKEEAEQQRDDELLTEANRINWGAPGGGEFYRDQRSIIFARHQNAYEDALKTLGVDPDELGDTNQPTNRDAELFQQLMALDPTQFWSGPEGPDWDAYYAKREEILSQMSPRQREALEKSRFEFRHPYVSQVERRLEQAKQDLQAWFDAPKYIGVPKEQEALVDQLRDLVSQVRGILALHGVNRSSRQILGVIAQLYGDRIPKNVLGTAILLSSEATAPLVETKAKTRLAFERPDLVVFYPFVYEELSEEEQELWRRTYGGRAPTSPQQGIQAPLRPSLGLVAK